MLPHDIAPGTIVVRSCGCVAEFIGHKSVSDLLDYVVRPISTCSPICPVASLGSDGIYIAMASFWRIDEFMDAMDRIEA